MSDDDEVAEALVDAAMARGRYCWARVTVAVHDKEAGEWAMRSEVDDVGYPEASPAYADNMLVLAQALRQRADQIEAAIMSQVGASAQVSWLGGDA